MNKKLRKHFDFALQEVEVLIQEAFVSSEEIDEDHPLSQEGLKNGSDIVLDYISDGELGLAYEHMLYMIEEPSLNISEDCKKSILSINKLIRNNS